MNCDNFSCLISWEQNVLIPSSLKYPRGAKCFNTFKSKILHLGKMFQYSQVVNYKVDIQFFIKVLCILPARYFQDTGNDISRLDGSEVKISHVFVIYDNF